MSSEAFTEESLAEVTKGIPFPSNIMRNCLQKILYNTSLILYILDAKSSSSAPTCNLPLSEERIGIKDPYNLKSIPSDVFSAVTDGGRKSDLTNIHLPDDLEKEDNIKESTNIESKSTRESTSK